MLLLVLSPSSEINISVSMHLSNSVHWKSRSDVEWSVDVESEFLTKSLGLNLLGIVKIDNCPFLVVTIVSFFYNDWCSFLIFVSANIKAFLVLPIDEVSILVGEDLPPFTVCAPDLHFFSFS